MKTRKKKVTLKAGQLIRIYALSQLSVRPVRIAQEVKATPGTVHVAIRILNGYLSGGVGLEKLTSHAYKEAIAFIKSEEAEATPVKHVQEEVVEKTYPTVVTPLERIAQAQELLMSAIVDFTEEESIRKSEKRTADLKAEYEARITKIETIIGEAKNSSIVGMINKRFGK